MQELDSKKEQDLVISTISDWENARSSPTLRLRIGGEDFSDTVPDGDVSQDGMAISLEATFVPSKGTGLPLRLYGSPVEIDISVSGVLVPRLRGTISIPEPNDDGVTTKLLAASAGSLADKYTLNETLEITGPPSYIAREALRRLPYVPGSIHVDSIDAPILYFARGTEDGPFTRSQHVSDILSKIQEKMPLFSFRDTAVGGCRGTVTRGFVDIPDIPDHMRFRAQDLLFWKSPTLALEQYAYVMVYKDNDEDFEPAIVKVGYPNRDFGPPAGTTLPIPFSGTDPNEAWRIAYLKAQELTHGTYKNAPILELNPLIEVGDPFAVTEVKEEEDIFYEREWLHYIDTWGDFWTEQADSGESGFETKTVCTVTLLNEEVVKAPTLILSLTTGIVQATASSRISFYGIDDGFWINTQTQDFLGVDETGFWVDEDKADGRAGFSAEEGFWILL